MVRLVALVFFISVAQAQRIVDTEYGQVRGHAISVDNGREQTAVEVFSGIPFAKPPVGALRFASPVPPDPWTGIFEADTLGNACPQDVGFIQLTNPGWEKVGEDCLHLNIYTPTEGTGPFAVMVWLFGGAYQSGANVQYPGHFLASRGVVVVTVNYRVNKFGFAYTANDACPGNAGMFDQNLGIQFVVDNIANFGGDPNRITVFGESAGGTSTSLNMVSPLSNTLFQQAILQSGVETMFITVNPPESNPEDYTRQIAEQLDCIRPDDNQMMDCLRSLEWEEIFENSTVTCAPGFVCLGMAPVVDGVGGFLPQMPIDLRASGEIMSGPTMAGINHEDGSLFLPLVAPAVVLGDCCNRTYFSHVLENNLVGYFSARLSNRTEDNMYHALDYMYSPWPYLHDTEANRHSLVDLTTDGSFGVYWDRQLKEQSKIAPAAYGYVFDHRNENSPIDGWLGTTHALDVIPIWGFPLLSFNEAVANDSMTAGGSANFTDADVQYSIFMQELWTNFAKFGNPTPSPVSNPLGGSTSWPAFTDDDMNVMYLGNSAIQVEKEYRQKEFSFWNHYLIQIAGDELGISDDWPEYGGLDSELFQEALHQGFQQMFMSDSMEDTENADW